MIGPAEQNHVEKMVATFKASPAKSSVVTGLVLILVIAWVRLLGGKAGPAAVQAARSMVAPAVAMQEDDKPESHRAGETDRGLRQWAEQPVKALGRNPFAIPLDNYPQDGAAESAEASGDGYWNLVRKSMSARADQQEQRQILMDNVRIAAGRLKLESTILGMTPVAMLNGHVVREGSTLEGFEVLKIEAREVIVEREGVKLALLMN